MIKLKICNTFQQEGKYDYDKDRVSVDPYDEEKWRDGKIYEFECLRDVQEFIDSCEIDITDSYDSLYNWYELDEELTINKLEPNLLLFYIGMHPEWRD